MKESSNKESITGTISRNTGGPAPAVAEPKSACIEANLLGRSPVSGVVDASGLAGLVRTLLLLRPVPTSNSATNQQKGSNNSATQSSYLLRIGSRGLHVHSSKQRDEGFESDTDSTRSGGEERLAPSGPASPAADEASSSANSSASSDTEDPESPTVSGAFPFRQRRRRRKGDSAEDTAAAGDEVDERLRKEAGGCEDELRELYAVSDVAFCHADPAFPRVAVWVVKRGQPQTTSQTNGRKIVTGSTGGLEAVVFECKNEESARKLVDSYNELSLRVKLEQFKNLRRKETAGSSAHSQATATLGRRPNTGASSIEGAGRYNLVQRVDGDGVTHIEVAGLTRKGAPSTSPSESEPSSIISISTPDVGDILQSQSNAVPNKSRLLREIEGVIIRSDVDQNGTAAKREATLRQRQPAILVAAPTGKTNAGSAGKDAELRKVWRSDASTTSKDSFSEDTPPQRPERRRYLRKVNKDGSSQDEGDRCQQFQSQYGSEKNGSLHPHGFKTGTSETAGRVVRGQYIRVSVDRPAVNIPLPQSPPNPPPPSQYNWVLVNIGDYNNNSGSPSLGSSSVGSGNGKSSSNPSVFSTSTWSGNKNRLRSVSRDRMGPLSSSTTFAQQQQWDEAVRRRRSRSKSPPRTQPMAHRYIDVASTSLRLGGLSRRWGDDNGGSWGSSGTLSFVGHNDKQRLSAFSNASSTNTSSCLKSVIKKNKRFGECSEPKKVTFSAFATVQVVD